ncbi:MAG TPA: hypothetical protein VFJ85_03930 [Acidimicrobiales bacterium]|nr:hypothetical protein [Acidimicrobiales bacterium]
MKVSTRHLRRHLEHMGTAKVPPPSPGFAARAEEHLRSLRPMTVVEPVRPLHRLRPVWVGVGLAAAAVAGVVGLVTPGREHAVVVTTNRPATTTPTSTTVPEPPTTATTVPARATTVAPAPTTTTAAPARPRPAPTTTTTRAPQRPVPTVPPATEPTTTTTATLPPEPPTTTTTAPPIAKLDLSCAAGSSPGPVFSVTCTWSAPPDAFAGWRVYRAVGTNTKGVAFTSADPAARTWVDNDVTQGNVYHYAVEAVAGDGRTIAKSPIVEVVCCTV